MTLWFSQDTAFLMLDIGYWNSFNSTKVIAHLSKFCNSCFKVFVDFLRSCCKNHSMEEPGRAFGQKLTKLKNLLCRRFFNVLN